MGRRAKTRGGRRGPGPPHDPRRGAPGAHRRGRRQPPATPLPALAAPPPPPSPPAATAHSTNELSRRRDGDRGRGDPRRDGVGRFPYRFRGLGPPNAHARAHHLSLAAGTTARRHAPPTPLAPCPPGGLARPHTHLHFPAPPPERHLPPGGGGTTTSAPLGRVGRPPAGREGGRATGKEGGGTGEGAGGARDSRETRKGRGEGGWSRGPVGHHLHLGGRRAKNTDPAIRNPQPRNPGRREAPTRGRLIVKRRSDRRSPGRNPGPQVRSKCR